MKIFLIRHGETNFSVQRRFTGTSDIPLTNRGLEQVHSIAKDLDHEHIKAVYSSPLIRTLQTAQVIAHAHSLKINVIEGIREIDFGFWEGLTYGEITQQFPDIAAAWVADPIHVTIPGGEPWSEFHERILSTFNSIIEIEYSQNDNQIIVIVTHGGPIQLIVKHFMKEIEQYWPEPASVTRLVKTGAILSLA